MHFPDCILAKYPSLVDSFGDYKAFIAHIEGFIDNSRSLVSSAICFVDSTIRTIDNDRYFSWGEVFPLVCKTAMEKATHIQESLNEFEVSFQNAKEFGKVGNSYEEKYFQFLCDIIQKDIEELVTLVEEIENKLNSF